MSFKIIWSEFAEKQLDEIYEYYCNTVNSHFANKIIREIINEPNKLLFFHYIGQEEELLKVRKIKYHYLIHKNYKLIYSIDLKNQFIKIADVFDTRQNPPKLKRTK